MGLEVESPEGLEEVVISRVNPKSPAGAAGLRAGDHIEAANGRAVGGIEEFKSILDSVSTGESLFLLVLRNEERLHLALVRED